MTTRSKTDARTQARKVPVVSELPVTRAMLLGVRDELGARIDELGARIDQTNARIDQTNARIDQTNARIDASTAEFRAKFHRVETLVEEQESRNRVVLEVVQGHNARFERIERSLDELRDILHEVARAVVKRPRG